MPTVNETTVSGYAQGDPKVIGSIAPVLSTDGTISNDVNITGELSISDAGDVNSTLSGHIQDDKKLVGDVSILLRTAGLLTNNVSIEGNSFIPSVLDRTAIHYNTTAVWNSTPTLIAERGHFYVYNDYKQITNPDGSITNLPAIKIGDGTSYLIDMPVLSSGDGDDSLWIDHINNMLIHVSEYDRNEWNSKVSATVNEPTENLIFTF